MRLRNHHSYWIIYAAFHVSYIFTKKKKMHCSYALRFWYEVLIVDMNDERQLSMHSMYFAFLFEIVFFFFSAVCCSLFTLHLSLPLAGRLKHFYIISSRVGVFNIALYAMTPRSRHVFILFFRPFTVSFLWECIGWIKKFQNKKYRS